jgi:hypothetical protein
MVVRVARVVGGLVVCAVVMRFNDVLFLVYEVRMVSLVDRQLANYIINVSRRQRPYVGVGVALESRASLWLKCG